MRSIVWKMRGLCAAAGLAALAAPPVWAEVADTLVRPASAAARPAQAVLLGIAQAGPRLVAVGERGLVVLSDDQAKTWRQAKVPVSVTLTAVRFVSDTEGWAVGHRGVILQTTDRGETWALRLQGEQYAELVRGQARGLAAQPAGLSEAQVQRAVAEGELLVRDGADKPFFDLSFADARHGIAVGAYGLCAQTADGGRTWRSCTFQLDNPKAAHLYAIDRRGAAVYIAGEQGLVLRGDATRPDAPFAAVPLPHAGSLFCLAIAASGEVLVGGLHGNAFVLAPGAAAFEPLPAGPRASFSGASRLTDGRPVLVNQIGQALAYDAASRRLTPLPLPPMAPLSGLLQTPTGETVVVGVRGVQAVSVNASSAPRAHP